MKAYYAKYYTGRFYVTPRMVFDYGERHDLSATEPEMLAVMLENDKSWSASIAKSIGPAESNWPKWAVPPGIGEAGMDIPQA